ncbi:NUDIX hydrolase [Natronomonas sp.]|uniref:NUDIX hydrolase n=1 Tax=Natronomonas sp. TaxID=2184060 RepID=UPI00397603ED
MSPADHGWPVLESVAEYETGWYTGGYDLVELPDGRTKRYYWAELSPAVVIVAVVDDPVGFGLPTADSDASTGPAVVMVEQYRPPIGELCYELPAGIVEDGERYVDAGARELEEEVGLVPESVELLEDFWCSTGVLRHPRGIVWAEGFSRGERKLDGSEFLDIVTVPVEEALDVARRDPANDATIEGLLLARADGYL